MKKLLTKISIILAVGFIIAMPAQTNALEKVGVDCNELLKSELTKDFIIQISEEAFTNQPFREVEISENESAYILTCIRMTTCKEETIAAKEGAPQKKEVQCKTVFQGTTEPCDANANAIGKDGAVACERVQVYISQSGIGLLSAYLGTIYQWAAGVIGTVSVFYMIWGGIKIATSGDDTAAYDEAKKKIIQSIAGLVLLFLSAVILYSINPNFFTFG